MYLKFLILLSIIFRNNIFCKIGTCKACIFKCGLSCKNLCNKDLNRFRKLISGIKIEKEDINKANCNYTYSNFNFSNKMKKLEGKGRYIKAEDTINMNKYFEKFNEYLGDTYPGRDKFEESYEFMCSYFVLQMAPKVQYDLEAGDADSFIVLEGTIKIPEDMELEEFKKKYFLIESDQDFDLMMFNMVKNCMNNGYGFSYYLDNLNKYGYYRFEESYGEDKDDKNIEPRNKKIDELIKKDNIDKIYDSKIRGKNLIIIYKYYRKGEICIFTQK